MNMPQPESISKSQYQTYNLGTILRILLGRILYLRLGKSAQKDAILQTTRTEADSLHSQNTFALYLTHPTVHVRPSSLPALVLHFSQCHQQLACVAHMGRIPRGIRLVTLVQLERYLKYPVSPPRQTSWRHGDSATNELIPSPLCRPCVSPGRL